MKEATSVGGWVFALAVAVTGAWGASCAEDGSRDGVAAGGSRDASVAPGAVTESLEARARVDELRARFVLPAGAWPAETRRMRPARSTRPAIGDPIATGFLPVSGGLRPVLDPGAKLRVARPATVTLPLRASAPANLTDDGSHVAVAFALRGASDAPAASASGYVVYAGALQGADMVHRVHAEGTEDYVVFETKPAAQSLVYDVDVSRVGGLRLVSGTLEFLDEGGTPRLRVAAPYAVDATGARTAATLAVEGCAFDTDPRGPWGRPVTRPGAASCGVRVGWAADTYPAMVDPSWVATGSMAVTRSQHTATLLGSGKVLVAGGGLSIAELYDPSSGTFSVTGSMTVARESPTATALGSGKVLLAGGWNESDPSGTTFLSSAELYDPTGGTFATTGSMTNVRSFHAATLLGSGKVLMAGGYNGSGAVSSAELCDATGATFTSTGSMATARERPTATLLGSGKVLVTGGDSVSGPAFSTAELYNPSGAGTFGATGAMAAARSGHTATLLGSGKVLVAGGASSAELYDPGAATFSATGSMPDDRVYHVAALLASGNVLIAGGQDSTGFLSSAELYNATLGTFGVTGSMEVARGLATGTALTSGAVLVAGGESAGELSSAELFALVTPGGTCSVSGECTSGLCQNGYCCASASCVGACMACTAGAGTCVPVTSAPDPDSCTGTQTCDPSGACKLALGQPCSATTVSSCASGSCSDGVCCNTACAGACDVCTSALGASADGTCTTAPRGYAGNPACGSGAVCSGTTVTCTAPCVSDIDCLATDYCTQAGTCQPSKAQGVACNPSADCAAQADAGQTGGATAGLCRECTSGFCVDGVCCNSACNGLCQACTASLKQSGSSDGTCDNAQAQTNPHRDTCATDAPSTCGNDGQCNGLGACSPVYPAGTSCGASSCDTTTNRAVGKVCDGSGSCGTSVGGVSCGNYVCAGGSCPTTCTSDMDCTSAAHCQQGACVAKGTNGAACTAASECASGVCADGVCCNAACNGQCEACDVPGALGTCSAVAGAPHASRDACTGGGTTCGGTCDGVRLNECAYASATTSCGSTCTNGIATASTCSGAGQCVVGQPTSCQTFSCDPATGACRTTCASDADCAGGYSCTTGACRPAVGAACNGSVLLFADGTTQDCSPYNCGSGGTCLATCQSDDDCKVPNTCDPSHACVAPGAAQTGSSGGCSVGGGRKREGATDDLIALAALVVAGARRRRRASPMGSRERSP
jgi:hypothetical protein